NESFVRRNIERRGLANFAAATLACAILAAAALLHLWVRTRVTERGYQLARLSSDSRDLTREHQALQIKAAELKSPQRIERLARLQRDQTRRELEWAPRRGMITDRRGEPLAVTREVDSIFADPSAFETIKSREAAADALSRVLLLPRKKIVEKLQLPDKRFVWLKRRVDERTAMRV